MLSIIKESLLLLGYIIQKRRLEALMKYIMGITLVLMLLACGENLPGTFESRTYNPGMKIDSTAKEYVNLRMIAEPRKSTLRAEIEIEMDGGSAYWIETLAYFQKGLDGNVYGNIFANETPYPTYYFLFDAKALEAGAGLNAIAVRITDDWCVAEYLTGGILFIEQKGNAYDIQIEKLTVGYTASDERFEKLMGINNLQECK